MSRRVANAVAVCTLLFAIPPGHAVSVDTWPNENCDGAFATINVDESVFCAFDPAGQPGDGASFGPDTGGPYIYYAETAEDFVESTYCLNPAQVEVLIAGDCAPLGTNRESLSSWQEPTQKTNHYLVSWRFSSGQGAPSCLTNATSFVQPGDVDIPSSRRRRTHRDFLIKPLGPCNVYLMEGYDFTNRTNATIFDIELGMGAPPSNPIDLKMIIMQGVGIVVLLITIKCGKDCLPPELVNTASVWEEIKAEFDKENAANVLNPGDVTSISVKNIKTVLNVYYLLGIALVASVVTYKIYIAVFPMKCSGCYELVRCQCDVDWRACDVPVPATNGDLAGEFGEMCNMPDPNCFWCDTMGAQRKQVPDGTLDLTKPDVMGRMDSCQGDICLWGEDPNIKERKNMAAGGYQVTIPDSCWIPEELVEVECGSFTSEQSNFIALQIAMYQTWADIYGPGASFCALFAFVPMVVLTYAYGKEVMRENPIGDPTKAYLSKVREKKELAELKSSTSLKNIGKCKCCKSCYARMIKKIQGPVCECLSCMWCCSYFAKRKPMVTKSCLLLCYVLVKMFTVKLNVFKVGAPPIITTTIDRCGEDDPHIAIYGIAGTTDFVQQPPTCAPDASIFDNFSWALTVGVPTIAFPAFDFAIFLPIVALPSLFTLTLAPFWSMLYVKMIWVPPPALRVEVPEDKERGLKDRLKAWALGEAEKRMRKKMIEEAHPRAIALMKEKFGLDDDRAEREWQLCLLPLLQVVDPRDLPAVCECLADTVEARILLCVKEKAIEAMAKEPFNIPEPRTEYVWGLIEKNWELIRDPFNLAMPDSIEIDPIALIRSALTGDIKEFLQYFILKGDDPAELMKTKMKGLTQKAVAKFGTTGKPVKVGQVAPEPGEDA